MQSEWQRWENTKPRMKRIKAKKIVKGKENTRNVWRSIDWTRLRNKIKKQNSRYVIPNQKLCKIERSYSKIHCSTNNWGQKRLLKKDYCKKDYSKPQVRKHRKSKKEYLNVKLSFTRKSPKRLTPSESATVSRTTSMMAKWQS